VRGYEGVDRGGGHEPSVRFSGDARQLD
jgi:hypothetical protein